MNRRQFLKGLVATMAAPLAPAVSVVEQVAEPFPVRYDFPVLPGLPMVYSDFYSHLILYHIEKRIIEGKEP